MKDVVSLLGIGENMNLSINSPGRLRFSCHLDLSIDVGYLAFV